MLITRTQNIILLKVGIFRTTREERGQKKRELGWENERRKRKDVIVGSWLVLKKWENKVEGESNERQGILSYYCIKRFSSFQMLFTLSLFYLQKIIIQNTSFSHWGWSGWGRRPVGREAALRGFALPGLPVSCFSFFLLGGKYSCT